MSFSFSSSVLGPGVSATEMPTASPFVRDRELIVHAEGYFLDPVVVEAHAVVDRAFVFEKSDARVVRVPLADVPRRRAHGYSAESDVRVVRDALRRFVRSRGEDDRAAEVDRIAAVLERDVVLELYGERSGRPP